MKERLLRQWARFVATHPWWVLAVMFVLIILSVIFASDLRMDMRWSDMLPSGDPMAQEFERIIKEFKSTSTILIVLQGDEFAIKKFADEIAPEVEKLEAYIERVDYKLDKEFFGRHGFMLTDIEDLRNTTDMFNDLNLVPLLDNINNNFEKEYVGNDQALDTRTKEDEAARALDGLYYWLKTMDTFINTPAGANHALIDSMVERFLYGDPYFISYNKKTLLLSCKPTFSSIDIEKDIAATSAIEEIIERTQKKYPGIHAGVTGIIPIQKYEMEYTEKAMFLSSIIALLLVIILFIISFRMWSAPILAGLNLVIAIIITAGIVAITIGRLNMMTSIFAVILIGLGIDYAIHLISVYNERRNIDSDQKQAMEETFARSGSGIITGALTTAAAFFALAISSTRGIKEMGIVLGIGICSAMITSLAALPAILVVRERWIFRVKKEMVKPKVSEFHFLGNVGQNVVKHRALYIIGGVVITGILLYQAFNLKFNYNMMSLEPDIPVIHLQDTIIKAFEMSPDFAMVTASSIEESWKLEQKAKALPALSIVEGIGDVCPPESVQRLRQPYVKALREKIGKNNKIALLEVNSLKKLIAQLKRLDLNIYELAQLAYIGGQDKIDEKCKLIIGDPEQEDAQGLIMELIEAIQDKPVLAVRQLNKFQKYYYPVLKKKLFDMANPELITLDALPQHIKDRYVNERGDNFLVTIYARKQMWDFAVLDRFTKQLQLVSPRATGTPPMFLHLINLIGKDGLWATILTLIVVLLLLWIDFRSLRLALLGMIPLISGGIVMMGIMKSFGMLLDFINVMGIPMIVGIGIDDGVHVIHRYKYEGFDKTSDVLRSTGKAILLTSLTTMAGFGALSFSSYPAYRSLGTLLTVGVAACFVMTVLFIPGIISLFRRKN